MGWHPLSGLSAINGRRKCRHCRALSSCELGGTETWSAWGYDAKLTVHSSKSNGG